MLYFTALENLKEAKELKGAHDISKLNQEEISDNKKSVTRNEIEAIIKIPPTNKPQV